MVISGKDCSEMKKILLSNFTIAFLLLITIISAYSIKFEVIDFYERKLYDLRMLMMKESLILFLSTLHRLASSVFIRYS
jgi:hypothetical protein